MALAFHDYAIAIILLAMMIPSKGTYGSSSHQHLKSLHFSLFHHETVNKTGYVIVNGLEGKGAEFGESTSPFGTLFTYDDSLRVTTNPSSKVVGNIQGTLITSSFDGFQNILIEKITLSVQNHKGSISIVGTIHTTKPSDMPVVGGTQDFLLVQGYVTYSPSVLNGTYYVYKIEFHLYWPPYATQAS